MSESEQTEPKGLDLPRLFALALAHRVWVIAPTGLALAGAMLFVGLVQPHYTSTAKVLLEDGESYYTRPDKAPQGVNEIIDEFAVASQAEAAKSPDVERKAMEKLKPEDLAEFSESGLFAWLSGRSDDPETRRLETFARAIDVYPQAKTRVLLFECTSIERGRARRCADALAEAFLESQQGAKDEETKSASRWLAGQIDALRAKVAAAEAQVEALRGRSGLQTGVNGVAVPSQQLGEIAGQIATARAAAGAANAKAAVLRDLVRGGRLDDIASVANDESLRRYAEQRVAVKAQIAENGRTMLPGHPRMKELAGELAELDRQIREAAMKRVHGLEDEARIAADQVKGIQAAVADQAKTVSSSDADQAKIRELEIDAKTARDQLESYLTKYREAVSREAASAAPPNGRIIAHALTPTSPSFPKTGPTLLLATLAAFFISVGLVVAKILLTDGGAPGGARAAPARPFGLDPPAPETAPAPKFEAADEAAYASAARRAYERAAARANASVDEPAKEPAAESAPDNAARGLFRQAAEIANTLIERPARDAAATAASPAAAEPAPALEPVHPVFVETASPSAAEPPSGSAVSSLYRRAAALAGKLFDNAAPDLAAAPATSRSDEPLYVPEKRRVGEAAAEATATATAPALEEATWTPEVERYVERLADASQGESLPIMVVGAGASGVLPVALAAARRLSRRGATALVDLGPSPPWISDLFDLSRAPRQTATLAELAADPSLLPDVAARDLSAPLDIFPSEGVREDTDLRRLWRGLSENYAFVVVHACDWRNPECIDAVEDMAALLVAAPGAELEAVEARVRRAFQDEDVAIKAFEYGAREHAHAA